MTLADGIFALLSGESTISAIVADRVYPLLVPEGVTLPAMTFQFPAGRSYPTFKTSGLQMLRMQVDVFGETYEDANAGREALRKFLNGYQGTLADGTKLQNVDLMAPGDTYEEYPRQFRCILEFYLYFNFAN